MVTRTNLPAPYFHTQINSTTHLLVHHDKFAEYPFIYAKLHPRAPVLVLVDSGCGGNCSAEAPGRFDELRTYLETFPLPPLSTRYGTADIDWAGGPLNPHGERRYLIVTTHVHFDHIGGIEALAAAPGARVISSGFQRNFIDTEQARRKHSLVDHLGLELPKYQISRFVSDGEALRWPLRGDAQTGNHEVDTVLLGLIALHTPGHTPDSLSIYDEEEGWLFTGDTFYARKCTQPLPWDKNFRQAIIFPVEGDWKCFEKSIEELARFVGHEESEEGKKVKIACAHTTCGVSAGVFLNRVHEYFTRWKKGDVPIKESMDRWGIECALWQDKGDPEFSVLAPKALMNS